MREEWLHDIKRIAILLGEWEIHESHFRKRVYAAFDKLYKDMELLNGACDGEDIKKTEEGPKGPNGTLHPRSEGGGKEEETR